MSPPSENAKSGAVRAALGVMAAVAVGALVVVGSGGPGAQNGHPRYRKAAATSWDGGAPPAGVRCIRGTYLAHPSVLRSQKMDDSRGRPEYLDCTTCGVPDDAGMVNPPEGLAFVGEGVELAWAAGMPELECGMRTSDRMRCACGAANDAGVRASDSCEFRQEDGDWAPMPWGLHRHPGQWRGACVTAPCGELAGTQAWPPECGPESK